MGLPLQGFTDYVRVQAAAVQGAAGTALDLTVGSVLRAVLEANAAVALWLQWLVAQVLAATRAATSVGADLDSWMADFGVVRLPASAATGSVVFARYAATAAASVPVGAQVRASASGVVYAVVADAANAAWTGAGYRLGAGVASVTVPVVAVVPGAGGNAGVGAVDQVASAIVGVDTVANVAAIAGGLDAEGDGALRARFGNFLDSRARATSSAVNFAVASVRQGLRWAIADGEDAAGAAMPGHFTVTVDDGSGAPSGGLVAAVSAAVDAVRPVGTSFTVRGPVVLPVVAAVVLTPAAGLGVAEAVSAAVQAYVAGLGVGVGLPVSRVVAIAFGASPSVQGASVLLNGVAADAVPLPWGVVQLAGVSVR